MPPGRKQRMSSPHFRLAFAAFLIVNRNDATTFTACIPLLLTLHEYLQSMLPHKFAVVHEARLISFVIALFKSLYQLTGVIDTFKAIGGSFFPDAIPDFAFAAMLRLSKIAVQATGTRFFVITMLVANHAVHAAGSEHILIHVFRHFHKRVSSAFGFFDAFIATITLLQRKHNPICGTVN